MTPSVVPAHSPIEAAKAAEFYGEEARFLAGGTDLVIQMRRGKIRPTVLIDISRIDELHALKEESDCVTIGSLASHKRVEHGIRRVRGMECLVQASRVVGGHQIRNVGTIGGNIANASPAADVVVALLALDAEVDVLGVGNTVIPATHKLCNLFVGPGRTVLVPGQLLTNVRVRKPVGRLVSSAFIKAGRRKAMEISIVCVAAALERDSKGTIRKARIALGAVGPTAMRARRAENLLENSTPDDALFAAAAELASNEIAPRDDVRASAKYRALLVRTLVKRSLMQCSFLAG